MIVAIILSVTLSLVGPNAHPVRPDTSAIQGASSKGAFLDLPAQITQDPLYPVLAQYDREIATLRDTQRIGGLEHIAASVDRDAAVIRARTGNARAHVAGLAASHAGEVARREASVLSALSSPQSARQDLAGYRAESARAAASTFEAFKVAMAQRTERAVDARAQQLREKESTLAFDLEKRDACRRLLLVVKLRELHLDKSKRAQLQAQLDALDASVARAVESMRAGDDAILASYRDEMAAREANDVAQMAQRIRDRSAENLAARERLRAQPLPAPLQSGYDFTADAAAIENGLSNASNDLSARFAQLRYVDETSRARTEARIAALRAARDALYRAILTRALQAELNRALT